MNETQYCRIMGVVNRMYHVRRSLEAKDKTLADLEEEVRVLRELSDELWEVAGGTRPASTTSEERFH